MPRDVMSKPALGLVVAFLAIASASCAGDESSSTDPVPTTSTAAPSADASSTPRPSATEAAGPEVPFPGVDPAAGVLLQEKTVQVHAPSGWEQNPPITDFDSSASRTPTEVVYLSDQRSMGGGLGLDELTSDQTAKLMLRAARSRGGTYERGDDVVIGEVTLARITGTDERGLSYDELGVERDGRLVNLSVQVPPRLLEQEPDLVESVFNSWTWR